MNIVCGRMRTGGGQGRGRAGQARHVWYVQNYKCVLYMGTLNAFSTEQIHFSQISRSHRYQKLVQEVQLNLKHGSWCSACRQWHVEKIQHFKIRQYRYRFNYAFLMIKLSVWWYKAELLFLAPMKTNITKTLKQERKM